jgi:hypothetical protein
MKTPSKQIHQIAQELEAGMKVFINRENLDTRSILDWEDSYGVSEFWEEELEKIENEWTDYVIITKMETREAFKIMADFIDEVDDDRLKEDLIKILNRKSPFANFKEEVETSSCRQRWFEFRTKKYEDYVKEQLKQENIKFE